MKTLFLTVFINISALCSFAQTGKLTVYFAFNSAEISPAEAGRLDSFVQSTQKVPMVLSGHTDSKGSDIYNDALSKRRADAVKNYLESDGFSVSMENAYGETKLVIPDNGDEIKGAANRRVEIVFEKPEPVQSSVDTATLLKNDAFISKLLSSEALVAGTTLTLDNLHFIGGRHRVLPSSGPQLRDLLNALQNNPNLKISIEGHVCCMPDESDGLDFDTQLNDLSYQRAKAVYEYLINAGIDKSRVSYKGFGHKVPLYPFPEKNTDEQVANRRVEIRVIEK